MVVSPSCGSPVLALILCFEAAADSPFNAHTVSGTLSFGGSGRWFFLLYNNGRGLLLKVATEEQVVLFYYFYCRIK